MLLVSKPKEPKNPANVIAGRNLKYFMDINGITNQQLAKSFGIEKESLQKIISGRNAISGPYNYILLNEYNCDLNFIYGGVACSDTLLNELKLVEKSGIQNRMRESIVRQMRYLASILENLDKVDDLI